MENCGGRQTFFYLVHTASSGMVSGIYSLRHCLKEHWLAQATGWSGTLLIREVDECRSRLKPVLWPHFTYIKMPAIEPGGHRDGRWTEELDADKKLAKGFH